MSVLTQEALARILHNEADLVSNGAAFVAEPFKGAQLTRYVELITILEKMGLDTEIAVSGFFTLHAEIDENQVNDPVSKAQADVSRVELYLLEGDVEHALALARSILPLHTPQTPYEVLRIGAYNQIEGARADALYAIARYQINEGNFQAAHDLAREMLQYNDIGMAGITLIELLKIYKAKQLVTEYEALLAEINSLIAQNKSSEDESQVGFTYFVEHMLQEFLMEASDQTQEEELAQHDVPINKEYDLDQTQLLAKARKAIRALLETSGTEAFDEVEVAKEVISICHYLEAETWHVLAPQLIELLKAVANDYFERYDQVMDEDGQPAGVEVLGREGRQSLVVLDGDKQPPSLHYLWSIKMSLAYAAQQFGDVQHFNEILDGYFSLGDVVFLYRGLANE